MKRISKTKEERRLEILETSQQLFSVKGYENVSVNEIIETIGVAKGTFYYYFESKAQILEAVTTHILDKIIFLSEQVAYDNSLNALEKLEKILSPQISTNASASSMKEGLHKNENKALHEKINVQTLLRLSPVLATIIEQGNKEGHFKTNDVLEKAQVLLAAAIYLFDEGLFSWNKEERESRMKIVREIIEQTLGAEKGIFKFLK